jgi:hypothetical protein
MTQVGGTPALDELTDVPAAALIDAFVAVLAARHPELVPELN